MKNISQNLNLTAKIFLGISAICGIVAIFFPPVGIAVAVLALIGGALEMAEAVEDRKIAKKEPRSEKFNIQEKSMGRTNVQKLTEFRMDNKNKAQSQGKENLISEA